MNNVEPCKLFAYAVFPSRRYYTIWSQLREYSSEKRRAYEAYSGVAGPQRFFNHSQYLCTSGLRFKDIQRGSSDDGYASGRTDVKSIKKQKNGLGLGNFFE
jgi:hypothetical protein